MSLETSLLGVRNILQDVDPSNKEVLLYRIQREIERELAEFSTNSSVEKNIFDIKSFIKSKLPWNSLLLSERGKLDAKGDEQLVHVDAFLYSDEDIDALCEEGLFSRNICLNCSSCLIKPRDFISHSMSSIQLRFIFQHLLPNLKGKTVLDVGSRTGAVLYGAAFYSQAEKIVGVELNKEFCDLQQMVKEQFNLGRVEVICSDISDKENEYLLKIIDETDVFILNNAFEYFLEASEQLRVWKFLQERITRKGTLIVSIPSLEESCPGIEKNWVWQKDIQCAQKKFVNIEIGEEDVFNLLEIFLYEVAI